MHLQTIINGKVVKSSSTDANKPTIVDLHLNKTTTIDLEVKNIPSTFWLKKTKKEFRWEITNNNYCVDTDDYTGGVKAELKLSKSNAGSKENPSKITVCADDLEDNSTVGNITINCSADSKITNTGWTVKECRSHQLVYLTIDQEGFYDHDVIVKVYNQKDTATPIHTFPKLLLKSGTNSLDLRVSNTTKEPKILYYTITHLNKVIYSGSDANMLLTVAVIDYLNNDDKEFSNNLTPVTIHNEEYFTQKYEPCKYSKIEAEYGNEKPFIIFDEEEPCSNPSDNIKRRILGGDEIKKLNVTLSKLKSDECKLNLIEDGQSHKFRAFDVSELDKLNIEYCPSEQIEDQLEVSLAYPYKHLDDLWEFFLKYNHYTFMVPELHTILVDLPINTCRYKKRITFDLVPDLSWAYNFKWGDPEKERISEDRKKELVKKYGKEIVSNLQKNNVYYEDLKLPLYDGGFDSDIEIIVNWIDKQNFFIKDLLNHLHINETTINIVTSYVRVSAKDFKFGYYALYSYDDKGKHPSVLNYTEKYPSIGKTVVAASVAVALLVDILLLVFTRGKNLPGLLDKAQKVFKISRTIAGMAGVNTYEKNEEGLKLVMPQIAISSGSGYKKQEDGSTNLISEITITGAPLFAIGDYQKHTIGEFVSNITGLGGFFKVFHGIVGTIQTAKSIVSPIKGKLMPTKQAKGKISVGFDLRDLRNKVYEIQDDIEESISEFIQKHFGPKIEMIVGFEGYYDAHINLKTNIDTQAFDLFDGINHYLNKGEVTFGKKQGINAYIRIDATLENREVAYSKLNRYIPDFLKDWTDKEFADISAEAEVSAALTGNLYFERTYSYNIVTAAVAATENIVSQSFKTPKDVVTGPGAKAGLLKMPHYRDNYIFTGLIGEVIVKLKAKYKKDKGYKIDVSNGTDKDGKTKPVVIKLIPEFVIPGKLIPVFDTETKLRTI